jgi:hypothetical protein
MSYRIRKSDKFLFRNGSMGLRIEIEIEIYSRRLHGPLGYPENRHGIERSVAVRLAATMETRNEKRKERVEEKERSLDSLDSLGSHWNH